MGGHIEHATIAQSGEKPYQLPIKRLAFYNRMRIAEASHPEKGTCYLFFYQNQFLTGKYTSIKKGSMLSKAFRKGIVVDAPHPLIDALFTPSQTLQLRTVTQLFKTLSKQLTPQETVYILSHFDSFVSKEKITEAAKSFFFQYRRSGQFRMAYQVLITLLDADPKNQWAHELSQHMDYLKYRLIYEGSFSEMKTADPLHAEVLCMKKGKASFKSLQKLLAEQKRWMDQAAQYIHYFKNEKEPAPELYEEFSKLLAARFTASERAVILWDSCRGLMRDAKARQDLVEALMSDGRLEDAAAVLMDSDECRAEQLITLLSDPAFDYKKLDEEKLQQFILSMEDQRECGRMLKIIIPNMLKHQDFAAVLNWLHPIPSLMTENFKKMAAYQDDPEQQLALGRLYHEMKQYQKAIDCFSWEMELNPSNPEPVQWLSKTYKEMGMAQEAKAYMGILQTMQKASNG
ncbi:tetratricopeptide repeat protein [Metabacillus sp. 84]|uniref:tetratricopeptide repeat protein n=1 Tax=unclassified Metabacillus TaxID=2675274 RepID=UPI003CF486B1